MHTNSLPPSDREDQPVTKRQVVRTFQRESVDKGGNKKLVNVNVYHANELIRSKLRALRASSPVYSNAQLGAKLGISGSVISQYLSDEGCIYPGNIPELERQAEDFLSALERRRASGVETTPSEVADQMLDGFEHIRKTCDLGAIVAESGEGKTRGIEIIRVRHPLTIPVEVTEWCCDKHAIMNAMWRAAAVDGWDGRTERMGYLVQKLRGSDRPWLFDDAHKLSQPALSLITTFQEKIACPVALIGCPTLVKKLEADSSGQNPSRAGICWAIAPKKQDAKLLLHLVRSIAKDINGELDDLIELCGQVAAHHGHNRAVHKQLKLASELRHADGDLTWCAAFRQAHTHLLRAYKLA